MQIQIFINDTICYIFLLYLRLRVHRCDSKGFWFYEYLIAYLIIFVCPLFLLDCCDKMFPSSSTLPLKHGFPRSVHVAFL